METKCCELFASALAEKSEAIMEALRVSDDAKHSFTAKFNLKLDGHVVTVEGTLSHSTKDSTAFDSSFEIEDPTAPGLPGFDGSVTLSHGGKSVTLDADAANRMNEAIAKL